jgi:WD40 repeat protein
LDNTLFSGSADAKIKIWNIINGELIRTLSGHNSWIWSLAILPDNTLVSGFDDIITIWNITKGKEVKILHGHNGSIWALVTFSDHSLISASGDSTIKIWNDVY